MALLITLCVHLANVRECSHIVKGKMKSSREYVMLDRTSDNIILHTHAL